MLAFPNAKVNLGLKIVRRRDDGYHDLETIFVPAGFCDLLEIIPGRKKDRISVSGITVPGLTRNNLVTKAVELIRSGYSIPPLSIHLHKRIPAGTGLGGGSSDAAFTLVLLNRIFSLHLSETDLAGMALNLGSDCPFFIQNRLVFASGRGEKMKPLKPVHGEYHLRIIIPPFHISTSEAFSSSIPNPGSPSPSEIFTHPIGQWKGLMTNRFEEFANRDHPQIRKMIEDLYSCGAVFASLSGSGSAVYGIFRNKPDNCVTEQGTIVAWQGKILL